MANGTRTRHPRKRVDPDLALLVRQGLAYVPAVARRYATDWTDLDELIAAGNLGLVQAALRFDVSREVKFLTYADWWIRKAIFEALETLANPVRVPRYRYEKLRWLKRTQARLARRGDRPTVDQLATAADLPVDETRRLLDSEPHAISLDHPSHAKNGPPLSDSIRAPAGDSPQQRLIRRDLGERLRQQLGQLEPRELEVIRLRFGLDGAPPRSLREAGLRLGLSREWVRRIELSALLKIRRLL